MVVKQLTKSSQAESVSRGENSEASRHGGWIKRQKSEVIWSKDGWIQA